MKTKVSLTAKPQTLAPVPTVKELRQSNHKVRIQRFRPYVTGDTIVMLDDNNARLNGFSKGEVIQSGGVTMISIRKPSGEEVVGVAECSFCDPFVKKAGVEVAIAKALELPVPQY